MSRLPAGFRQGQGAPHPLNGAKVSSRQVQTWVVLDRSGFGTNQVAGFGELEHRYGEQRSQTNRHYGERRTEQLYLVRVDLVHVSSLRTQGYAQIVLYLDGANSSGLKALLGGGKAVIFLAPLCRPSPCDAFTPITCMQLFGYTLKRWVISCRRTPIRASSMLEDAVSSLAAAV